MNEDNYVKFGRPLTCGEEDFITSNLRDPAYTSCSCKVDVVDVIRDGRWHREVQFPGDIYEPRVSNGQTVGEYLDYLFGSTREGEEASASPSNQGEESGVDL